MRFKLTLDENSAVADVEHVEQPPIESLDADEPPAWVRDTLAAALKNGPPLPSSVVSSIDDFHRKRIRKAIDHWRAIAASAATLPQDQVAFLLDRIEVARNGIPERWTPSLNTSEDDYWEARIVLNRAEAALRGVVAS